MDICLTPSLQHMCCVKIVSSLLNDPDILKSDHSVSEFLEIKSKLTEDISKLTPFKPLQRKVERFIIPLLCEVENWSDYCVKCFTACSEWKKFFASISLAWSNSIPQCWRHDGTLDREKLIKRLIKDVVMAPLDRFTLACTFCTFEDIADYWNDLYASEKAYLIHRCDTNPDISYFIFRHWMEWLQSSNTNKDWESFVEWALETPVWKSNVYILKRVLQTLRPTEKRLYLVKALTGNEIPSDIIRFGLPMMTPDEREVIFRESTSSVFKCILSWPLSDVFSDIAEKLWPYITEDTFLDFVITILKMIKYEKKNLFNLVTIMKSFWAQSPAHYKEFVQKNSDICLLLNIVLEHDFSKKFPRKEFFRKL